MVLGGGPGGRPAGALRFDARPFADPAARDRLVAAVVADRRLLQGGLTGLVPVADLITARGEVWLLTGEPAGPTVTDLLARRPAARGPARARRPPYWRRPRGRCWPCTPQGSRTARCIRAPW
ncbi:hypothetical protein [Planomonospora algeriensis]